tara:strand:- start:6416 stop:7396 length:981 start_codon:yes stop_codon:yes gene_type:complete
MLLICYGTRPEYLKVKPLMEALDRSQFKTLFTGQHVDLVDAAADYRIDIISGNNRLDSLVSSIMDSVKFEAEGINRVLVQGDTTSAFAVALSAFHHKIEVIHLEAGLRTYDLEQPYPEEANRQMISRIASLHLCPTELAKERLLSEKVSGRIEVVGNTVLDNLRDVATSIEKKVLVTMHRRENHSDMKEWFLAIESLAQQYSDCEFVLPIHPNPNVVKYKHILNHVKVVPPMPYQELVDYMSRTLFIVTDSGGIQEEAAFLKKPCLVCRKETERSEGLNNFSLLCESPNLLAERVEQLRNLKLSGPCPYGDGETSQRIVDILGQMG